MVIVMISLIFFGMMQVVVKINAEQVQQWAAFRASRSRVVGFNDAFVDKVWHAASVINSGKMLAPEEGMTAIQQLGRETYMIGDNTTGGEYFAHGGTVGELSPWFNYEAWDHLPALPAATTFDVYDGGVQQDYSLDIARLIPFLAASFGTTNAVLKCDVKMDNHFPLYLNVN